jgi:hypothetical protein
MDRECTSNYFPSQSAGFVRICLCFAEQLHIKQSVTTDPYQVSNKSSEK